MPEQEVRMPREKTLEPAGQRLRTEREVRSNRGGDGPVVSSGFSARSDLRAGALRLAPFVVYAPGPNLTVPGLDASTLPGANIFRGFN